MNELRFPALRTERLLLRRWRADDLAPFAALNADPVVMEHFQELLTRAESDAFVDRIEAEFDDCGFGLWAVEVRGEAPFIGYVGLHRVPFEAPFTPAVEVGWRLARSAWGHGYATEAGRAAVSYGLDERGLDEIVSFTTPGNERSWRVMERIGMIRDPNGDFDHPNLPAGHRLRGHVLYRSGPARERKVRYRTRRSRRSHSANLERPGISVRVMTEADSTPEAVAREYFRRMQSGEPVAELFTEDGELIGLGARVVGRDAIREFYATARSDAAPRPEPLTVVAAGNRVLAEVYIHLASGERMHVVDGFEVRDGLIRSLTYFTADYPTGDG